MSKVVNFGCRLNSFEGKKIEELLTNNNENMVVINSCAVTNETERQVRQTIRRINHSRLPEDISSNEDSIFAVKVVSTNSGKCSSSRAVTAKAVNVGAKVLEDIFA